MHMVESFSSWIRMKNSLPLTVLSLQLTYINIGRNSQSMSLLLCKLGGKQPDKVHDKVFKMSHDEPSEESEKCKRRTRYEVQNAT